jgi:hypothetical protein
LPLLSSRRQRTGDRYPLAMIHLPRLPESQGRGALREQESLFRDSRSPYWASAF